MYRVPKTPLHELLTRHHRAVHRALVARLALRAAAALALALALAVAEGAAFLPGPGVAWARLVLLLFAFAYAIAAAVLAFRREAPAFDAWLEGIEHRFPELRSWLRNAVELAAAPPPDSSPALARAVSEETGRRLESTALQGLRPRLAPRRPFLALAGAIAIGAALSVLLPARTQRSWATLWNPSLAAPAVRLEVEPGSVKLTPGAALAVRARVWGTPRSPALLRDGQATLAATAEGQGAHGERLWRFDLTQLTREQDYRVKVASVTSPRYRIALAGDPIPVSFEVEYRAPAYARLPVQSGSATRGDLTALRGSIARLVVTFDRDLTALDGTLPNGAASRWKALTPRRWQGEIPLEREGEYALHAVADRGEGRFRYRVTPLADAPPLIAVRVPSGDVDLPNGQQVPLEVYAQDDFGLTQLRLQYRKDDADSWSDVPLARFPARPREARVASRWDASALALLPGESATFRFELQDDNTVSGPGRAVSPSFRLRFPSLADLYEKLDTQKGDAQTTMEKVTEKAKELQKSLDKLARQTPRPAAPSNQSFERSEEMKSTLQRQQELGQKIDEAAKQLDQSLQEATERRAFDEQLTRKLEELNALVKQVQSKEFKEALQRMQDAMEKMDRRALENELPNWREENQKMVDNLERTIELIKKLREEEKLQALAQRAEELKAMQDQLNQKFEAPDRSSEKPGDKSPQNPGDTPPSQPSTEQDKLADETEKLAQDAKESGEQSETQGKESLEEASRELSQEAAPSQREASRQSQQNQRSQASKSGQKASQSLDRASKSLRKSAASMQAAQDNLDLAAVRRAAQDLLSLQRASDRSLDPDLPIRDRADTQTDLSEGTSRVADSLFALARETPFISPKLSQALGRAVQQLSSSGRDLGTGNRGRGEEAARGAGESLNEAILELRNTEQSMCQNPGAGTSGTPKPGRQQRGQSMDQLSRQQSDLNQRSQSLSRKLSQQMRLQAGDKGEMERMAEEQQRIREQVGEIRRNEEERKELLGRLDQTEQEMKEVEEMLRNGTTDPSLEEKQTHILSRMLDATRSLNRRDFDPERESRPGEDVARNSPSELPPDLLKESDRLRLDLLKAEADRYPAQYRSFIEAYLRSLNGSPSGSAPASPPGTPNGGRLK
jgi:hypothetical protein